MTFRETVVNERMLYGFILFIIGLNTEESGVKIV